MDLLTTFVRVLLSYRVRAIARYATSAESIQRKTLAYLVRTAANTLWGKEHDYKAIRNYEGFAAKVPVGDYASLKPYIQRMMDGEGDILWKGRVTRFATSSGTTSDVRKFIPVSRRHLKHGHLRGGRDVTATYLHSNRNSHVALGESLIVSGCFREELNRGDIRIGDISAAMSEVIPPFFRNFLHIRPDPSFMRIRDDEKKHEAIAEDIIHRNLVSFSGLPHWNLLIMDKAIKIAGVSNAEELWPNMELFAHGGVSIVPYRQHLEKLFPSGKLHLIETYNASEGFFGVQTAMADPAMTLMLDYDVFYEFIPMDQYGQADAKAVPLWDVELEKDYAILVSTSSGLWRYDMGDVVRFTHKNPYRLVIIGRTHQNIDVWSEDLSVQQAEKALAYTCRELNVMVREFTVAPLPLNEISGCHQWLVEFEKEPASLDAFASLLEERVQEEDIDYKEYRESCGGHALRVVKARPGLFYQWMESRGKIGGQNKVPRLSTSRQYMDQLLAMNEE